MVYILQKCKGHKRQRQGPFQIKEKGWKLNAICDPEPEKKNLYKNVYLYIKFVYLYKNLLYKLIYFIYKNLYNKEYWDNQNLNKGWD